MIRLSGQISAADEAEAAVIRTHLPTHMALTRAEPGCISFCVTQTADPLVWQVEEAFADKAAFDAHQSRNRASAWFTATQGVQRAYTITEE
jgi:quinol monooxygenase YgiN